LDIYAFLDQHGIAYQRYDHPPVFTCEEAERWVPEMPAAKTKNLFLRDRKGKRHFLVVVGYHKSVDLKSLSTLLQSDRLVLGSAERLGEYLGVEPGSVTILALANDAERRVEVVFDADIAAAESLRCHPLVNTATLSITRVGIERFLQATGHSLEVVDIPARGEGSEGGGTP
jgi:Ala-tRNA(Pro) deacylase